MGVSADRDIRDPEGLMTHARVSLPVPVELLEAIAALVEERLAERLAAPAASEPWPEYMSVDTAGRYLDVSAERIRKLVARREIPFHQEGRGCRVLLNRRDLDAWMAGQRHEARRRP
jgi:excisionase family DNA binding protein